MLSSIFQPLLRGALLVVPIILSTTTAIFNEDLYSPQTNINNNNNNNYNLDALSRDVMRSVPPSSPVVYAPQATPFRQQNLWNQYDKKQQSDPPNVQNTRTWFAPNSDPNLREFMNFGPPMMNQEDAKKVEEYMINYGRYSDGQHGNPVPLNLANINSRPLVGVNPMFTTTASPIRIPSLTQPIENRAEQIQPGNGHKMMTRKGKVDDVIKFNGNNNILPRGTSLANKLVHDHLVQTLPPGCIGRAAPYTSKCEDHLIKRLSQDATEGRTVLDVSRRVCCALFYHKDCISRVVVELCPDSNPKAADLLLGSRNLDLTMSCQRFNRDGCNGSPSSLHYSLVNQSILLTFALVTTIWCCWSANLVKIHA